MRAAAVFLLLFCLGSPAFAHDDEYGLIHCYSGKHKRCPQDTLVFGTITKADAETYTLVVSKVFRSKGNIPVGTRLRLTRGGWEGHPWSDRKPKVNGAILVSFLREGQPPYQPHHLVPSTTTDWRRMTVDYDGYNSAIAMIQRFVRSGGADDDFFGYKADWYVRKRDGTVERIYTDAEHRAPLRESLPTAPAPGRRGTSMALLPGTVLAVLVAAGLGLRWRRGRAGRG